MLRRRSQLICICGGSGSGKTTLAEAFQAKWASDALVISTDSYYKDFSGIAEMERSAIDFDSPDSFDGELCRMQMGSLLRGESISLPRYDYSRHLRTGKERIEPRPCIVLEGIFSFHDEELLKMASLCIFLECPLTIMKDRRIRRDMVERGRTMEEVEWRFDNHVAPAYMEHILPKKPLAHIVLNTAVDRTDFGSEAWDRIDSLVARQTIR